MASTTPFFSQVDAWLEEVATLKTASAKKFPSNKKLQKKAAPDGTGESSHVSDDVDDNTQDAEEGERSTENSEDVKNDVQGQAVDEAEEGGGGSQDDKQFNIGTSQSATGEDPSVEDDYKGTKDDPGTSHPANTEELGEKYSSMQLGKLLKLAENIGNALLADIVVDTNGANNKNKTVSQKAAEAKMKLAGNNSAEAAAKSGYDLADQVQKLNAVLEKAAADFTEQIIRDANIDADLVGSYLHSYYNARVKQAEDDEAAEGEDHGSDADDQALAAAMAGGGGMGGEDASAGGEAPPVDAGGGAGGGDVMGALNAATQGEEAPVSKDQALQELHMALQELGIPPEALAELAAAAQGGGGGDAGPAPEEAAKYASAVKKFRFSGKAKFEEAKTAAQRRMRDDIKSYIVELTGLNK